MPQTIFMQQLQEYSCHILIADEQFLLLIGLPIQDCAEQVDIYEVFTWIYLMEITQHTMTYKTSIWA